MTDEATKATTPKADPTCPKCGAARVVKPGMFHFRGVTFSGLVCEPCNALWDNPEDSFERHVLGLAEPGGDADD